jgi:hypothetical protein
MARDSRYPDNWADISSFIRAVRAGGRCEARWDGHRCQHRHGGYYPTTHGRIQLSTHHIGIPKADGSPGDPRDKSDCRPENLLAVCWPCHLKLDYPLLKDSLRATRERKAREAWEERGWVQMELALS